MSRCHTVERDEEREAAPGERAARSRRDCRRALLGRARLALPAEAERLRLRLDSLVEALAVLLGAARGLAAAARGGGRGGRRRER